MKETGGPTKEDCDPYGEENEEIEFSLDPAEKGTVS
jgi:hypothetical protein